jgi:hypothetical protein
MRWKPSDAPSEAATTLIHITARGVALPLLSFHPGALTLCVAAATIQAPNNVFFSFSMTHTGPVFPHPWASPPLPGLVGVCQRQRLEASPLVPPLRIVLSLRISCASSLHFVIFPVSRLSICSLAASVGFRFSLHLQHSGMFQPQAQSQRATAVCACMRASFSKTQTQVGSSRIDQKCV